jgi:signal transduction histidine kinase
VRRVLRPWTSPTAWTRALHLALGLSVAVLCALVWPGLEDAAPRTIAGLYAAPLPLLVVLVCVPVVRRSEGVQVRALVLRGDDGGEVSVEPARGWAGRGRLLAWLCARVWLGVTAAEVCVLAVAAVRALLPGGALGTGWAVLLVPLAVLAAGGAVAALGALTAAIARRLLGPSAAERLAAQRARTERLLERTRLAAELHDSIGHALTVTLLQAEAAREVAGRDPAFVDAALEAIADSARRAGADLERVLGLLREPAGPVPPAPGLAELAALARSAEAAGAQVELAVGGPVADLPPLVSEEAYRIVQEALTNALRHAGPVPVRVRVAVGAGELALTVENPAPAVPLPSGAGTGSGVRRVRERVALLGGTAQAGPVEGGWRVEVRLPLHGAP